jgi:cell division transport system ATP-binding protein
MIQAFRVTKRYDAHGTALRDVSLHVPKGEFCFLTGPSGAGKTTLLRLFLREEMPTEGQILVGGRNVSAMASSKVPEYRRTLGVVFQDFKLLKTKTIVENVAFVLRVLGVPEQERRRRAFPSPAVRRARGQARLVSTPALGWRAAARRDRAGAHQ